MKLNLFELDYVGLEGKQAFEPYSWVKVLEIPSLYSFNEALLLCQISNHEWLAWIPDHGEAILYCWQIATIE